MPEQEEETCWRCRGYKAPEGAGASTRWHITSTDIHEASFPLLNTIISRVFGNAVSFLIGTPFDGHAERRGVKELAGLVSSNYAWLHLGLHATVVKREMMEV